MFAELNMIRTLFCKRQTIAFGDNFVRHRLILKMFVFTIDDIFQQIPNVSSIPFLSLIVNANIVPDKG